MKSSLRLRTHLIAYALLALLLESGSAAWAASLVVRLEGVQGRQETNVRTSLGIRQLAESKTITESRVRHLHDLAPREIAKALEPLGYYLASVQSSLEKRGERWIATYRIQPGPPVRLDTVRVQLLGPGSEDPALARAVQAFPLRAGDVLDHGLWEQGKATLAGRVHTHGYLDATFRAHEIVVDPKRSAARASLLLETGPRKKLL